MLKLNLPAFTYRLKKQQDRLYIYDTLRKKFIFLTPEEWVRQHFIHYLIRDKKTPPNLIRIEHPLRYHQLKKRADIVVYDRFSRPLLLVECKASTIQLNDKGFFQLMTYYSLLKVPFVTLTNGLVHFFGHFSGTKNGYLRIGKLPEFKRMEAQK